MDNKDCAEKILELELRNARLEALHAEDQRVIEQLRSDINAFIEEEEE